MRVAASSREGDTVDLQGHTLVIPGAGGLAHLGELAVDALISTYGLSRVAVVRSRHLMPVVMASAWEAPPNQGGDADAALRLTTAAEIYQSAAAPRLSVLQYRSGPVEGRRRAMADEVWQWARKAGVVELVVVSSCSSHVKADADFGASTELRYIRFRCDGGNDTDAAGVKGPDGAELPLLPLDHARQARLEVSPLLDEESAALVAAQAAAYAENQAGPQRAVAELLRGAGLARPLVQLAAADSNQGVGAPGLLCLMGMTADVPDFPTIEKLAKVVCLCLAAKLSLEAPAFKVPPSWQFEAAASMRQLWG